MIVQMTAGGRRLDVRMIKRGRKIHLQFRNYAPLREEVKCMRGAQWDHGRKEWAVTDCRRNHMQLDALQGVAVPELDVYYGPLDQIGGGFRASFYAHQVRMLEFLLGRKRCVLAAEMRTGKTLAVIEGMEAVGGKWLYVAPARVLTAIELELDKWDAGVRPQLCSYASLRKLLEGWSGPAPIGVVFDESSRLKTPGAQRTKAAQHLADSIREEHDGYVWLLTGTPAPKNPTDWWAQAEIACPGFLRESSRSHLERRCAVIEVMEVGDRTFGNVVDWKADEVEKLGLRLDGLVQVHLSKDCLDLPEIRYDRRDLPVSKATTAMAKLVADGAETAIEALSKLRQLSDGFLYGDDGEAIKTDTPKDEALRQILAEHDEFGRLVIYAGFRASVDRVQELCEAAGWAVLRCDGRGWAAPEGMTDKQALREMDRGAMTGEPARLVFVGNPTSGGMGLNLCASPTAVYWSSDFNGESRMQSVRRIHSPGMDHGRGATVVDLCHLPTDALVLANLDRKQELQGITMEAIRGAL